MQVRNDAVDQLTKFNQRLADLARTATPHTIDGLLVTKADTVDDKVSVTTSGGLICIWGGLPALQSHEASALEWQGGFEHRVRKSDTSL